MKQHITKKQWDELGEDKQIEFLNKINGWVDKPCGENKYYSLSKDRYNLPNIGQIIKFLGDDYVKAIYNHMGNAVLKKIKADDLCDALWRDVVNIIENQESSKPSKELPSAIGFHAGDK